jgi:hypothetical protein
MAELEYVPARAQVPTYQNVDGVKVGPGGSVTKVKEGYQLCATKGEDLATYAECENHFAALERCFQEFPLAEGYAEHYVKCISTGETIYPGKARTIPAPDTALSIGNNSTGKAKPVGLSLNEPDSPSTPALGLSEEGLGLKL